MSITLTKKSVSLIRDNQYRLTVTGKYFDGETVYFEQDFSAAFDKTAGTAKAITEIEKQMKSKIAEYDEAKALLDDSALDTALTSAASKIDTEVSK